MTSYKRYARIKEPNSLLLTDLPFKPGQVVEVVEVVVIAQDGDEAEKRVRDLQAMLKGTQALPAARAMSEDDIAAEIKAYRAGQ